MDVIVGPGRHARTRWRITADEPSSSHQHHVVSARFGGVRGKHGARGSFQRRRSRQWSIRWHSEAINKVKVRQFMVHHGPARLIEIGVDGSDKLTRTA